jgi:hypothetical protein
MAEMIIILRDRPREVHSFFVLFGTPSPAFTAVLGLFGRRLWRILGPRRREARSGISLWIVVALREWRLKFRIGRPALGAISVASGEFRTTMPSGALAAAPASEPP